MGCPRDTAPPWMLTFAGSRSNILILANTTTLKASLISHIWTSSFFNPAAFRTFFDKHTHARAKCEFRIKCIFLCGQDVVVSYVASRWQCWRLLDFLHPLLSTFIRVIPWVQPVCSWFDCRSVCECWVLGEGEILTFGTANAGAIGKSMGATAASAKAAKTKRKKSVNEAAIPAFRRPHVQRNPQAWRTRDLWTVVTVTRLKV